MVRVVMVWILLLVAILKIAETGGTGTCADEGEFESFIMAPQFFSLVHGAQTPVSLEIRSVDRKREMGVPNMTSCFRFTFTVSGGFTILKLRAGIYVKGDSIPDGKPRYTKRKSVGREGEQVLVATMDICPSKIRSVDTASCCESEFEVVGYVLIQEIESRSSPTRVWLPKLDNCRELNENKPFQVACTVQPTCRNSLVCEPGSCRIGFQCFPIAAAISELSCGDSQEVVVNDEGECVCPCPESQCFDGEKCVEDADYEAICPPGQVTTTTILTDNRSIALIIERQSILLSRLLSPMRFCALVSAICFRAVYFAVSARH
uniref:EGF-like domain-containing protein n=1 Tax=Rhodosorus marinus TaxID=101924 RepID=A0A6T6NGW9_9RHOD|mmetsp:Transcript_6962/g.10282  ORF Transcript_6962/g.10282 Transcript_6962/m.10282 type:complete len:319 (+) Transcript_6962:78-1034(+)